MMKRERLMSKFYYALGTKNGISLVTFQEWEICDFCRQILLNRVSPRRHRHPDSLFGDVPDVDRRKAAEIAKDSEKWEASGLQTVANLFRGKCSKKSNGSRN